jgi:hypothetical protein
MSKQLISKRKRKQQKKNSPNSKVWSLADPMPKSEMWVPEDQIFRVTFNVEVVGNFSSSTTVPVYSNTEWALVNFPNYTDLTTVFDQYRIVDAEYWLLPRTAFGASASSNYGLLTSCVDYDDSANLASVNDGLGHTNSVTTSGNQGHYHHFKPRFAMAAYSGAFTSYANMPSTTWIDCGSPSVKYYGVKTAITATDLVYTFDLLQKMVVEFRNKRR